MDKFTKRVGRVRVSIDTLAQPYIEANIDIHGNEKGYQHGNEKGYQHGNEKGLPTWNRKGLPTWK